MTTLTTTEAAQLSTALVKRAMDGQASPTVPTFGMGTMRTITAHLAPLTPEDRATVASEALAHMVTALAAVTEQLAGVGNE